MSGDDEIRNTYYGSLDVQVEACNDDEAKELIKAELAAIVACPERLEEELAIDIECDDEDEDEEDEECGE